MLVLRTKSSAPVEIRTPEFDEMVHFWRAALRLREYPGSAPEDASRQIRLADDGGRIRLVVTESTESSAPVRLRVGAYDTQDVTAATERFIALGASGPEDDFPNAPGTAVLTDPAGNTIEITARWSGSTADPQPRRTTSPPSAGRG